MSAGIEDAPPEDAPLRLRSSMELGQAPAERPPAPPAPSGAPANPIAAAAATPAPRPDDTGAASRPSPTGMQLGLAGLALMASVGWLYERRRRRLMETEKDSVLWAHVQPPASSIVTTAGNLDDILPDSPDPAEAARAIYVTAIGETNSRREATLIDLHQLDGKLARRRGRGDTVAAVLLLQQHLVDFRFTSPWVFLELRELYRILDRQKEWEIAREAFRARFGQNAPSWTAPSTSDAELLSDAQLCADLTDKWPYREARMFILRWMLGEPEARQKGSGPPMLHLGVYRDMMLLDTVLDDMMLTRPAPVDSLL